VDHRVGFLSSFKKHASHIFEQCQRLGAVTLPALGALRWTTRCACARPPARVAPRCWPRPPLPCSGARSRAHAHRAIKPGCSTRCHVRLRHTARRSVAVRTRSCCGPTIAVAWPLLPLSFHGCTRIGLPPDFAITSALDATPRCCLPEPASVFAARCAVRHRLAGHGAVFAHHCAGLVCAVESAPSCCSPSLIRNLCHAKPPSHRL